MKLNICVFFYICLLFFSEAAHAVQLRVVANVNGSMISSLDLENKVKPILHEKGLSGQSPESNAEVAKIYRETLDKMIQEKLIVSEAKRTGFSLRPDYVEQHYQSIVKNSGMKEEEFLKTVARQGVSKGYILEEIEVGAIMQAFIEKNFKKKEVVVTDADIKKYFDEHRNNYAQKTGICNISMIVYPNKKTAEDYSKRIAAGQISFKEAARRVTVGPNKEGGGSLGSMHVSELAPGIRQAIAPITKGATPLLGTGDTFAQIYVNSCQMQKGSQIKMTDKIKEEIKAKLSKPNYDKEIAEYAKELNKKAIIDIRY